MAYVLGAIVVFVFIWYVPAILYFSLGWFKWFYHDILKWHRPDERAQWHDGCSMCSTCKYCGKSILQDSQGNWF